MLDDFIEAKRGGICGIMGDSYINSNNNSNFNSYSNSNNNSKSDSIRQIWYIDANNLYGYAMMQKLPYKNFEYITVISLDEILKTQDDSDHGYYIVCDTNYSKSCKDRTEQPALMPNKRKKNDNELGYREIGNGRARTEKIFLDQNKKTEYMVHHRMLKFYVMMSVKVTKIHRVIKIKQDYICRDFIQNNNNKRATAKTEAEKGVRKLMNNSLYGRRCMNPVVQLYLIKFKLFHLSTSPV